MELLSIGTLFGFTIVAASVIVLHYQPVSKCQFQLRPDASTLSLSHPPSETGDPPAPGSPSPSGGGENEKGAGDERRLLASSQSHDDIGRLKKRLLALPVLDKLPPGDASVVAVVALTTFMVAFWLLVLKGTALLADGVWWSVLLLIVFCLGLVLAFLLLVAHEQNRSFLTFQVLLVFPGASLLCWSFLTLQVLPDFGGPT